MKAQKPGSFNPKTIYPYPSENMPSAQVERQNNNDQAKALAGAELQMSGVALKHGPPKSRAVDIIGGLIIFSGAVSILSNHTPLSLAFSAVYITVGLGVIRRSAMARKLVIIASIIGLLTNILGLLGTSLILSGKDSILPILSILLSMAIELIVLSVLTWHQTEKEFR